MGESSNCLRLDVENYALYSKTKSLLTDLNALVTISFSRLKSALLCSTYWQVEITFPRLTYVPLYAGYLIISFFRESCLSATIPCNRQEFPTSLEHGRSDRAVKHRKTLSVRVYGVISGPQWGRNGVEHAARKLCESCEVDVVIPEVFLHGVWPSGGQSARL